MIITITESTMEKANNDKAAVADSPCPKCQSEMILKENMFFWREKYLSGLVCEKCNALYDNPKESFIEYVKNP